MKPTLLHSFVTSPLFSLPASFLATLAVLSVFATRNGFHFPAVPGFPCPLQMPPMPGHSSTAMYFFHLNLEIILPPQNRSIEAIFCTSSMGAPTHLSFAFLSCCTVIVYLAISSLVFLRTGIYFLLLHSRSLTHNRHSRNIY